MSQKTAIANVIKSLADVERRFGLRRSQNLGFFTEWYEDLPEISQAEKESLDLIRRRYLYHLNDGNLTEGTVTLLLTGEQRTQKVDRASSIAR